MAFLPFLRHGDLYDLLDTTSKVLNEIPNIEKHFHGKLADRFIYKTTKTLDDGFEIEMHLAGVGKDNIHITLSSDDHEVTVSYGDNRSSSFDLPSYVDVSDEGYKATYIDGVLRLFFKMRTSDKKRREIKLN
jgi:HSP20 family molecular chaperone IbpA